MNELDPEAIYEHRLRALRRKEMIANGYRSIKRLETITKRASIPAFLAPAIGGLALMKSGYVESNLEIIGTAWLVTATSVLAGTGSLVKAEVYKSQAYDSATEAAEICHDLGIPPERWITDELG